MPLIKRTPKALTVVCVASDLLALAMDLQTYSDQDIRAALRLLHQSNPRLVRWMLSTLANLYNAATDGDADD